MIKSVWADVFNELQLNVARLVADCVTADTSYLLMENISDKKPVFSSFIQ